MTILAYCGIGVIVLAIAITAASFYIEDLVDHVLAGATLDLADSDADWDAEIDAAIRLTETPLYQWLTQQNPQALDALAVAEAARADWETPYTWSNR